MHHRLVALALGSALIPACSDFPQVADLTSEASSCTPLVCGTTDCGAELGPAGASDATLGFDIHPGTGNLHLAVVDVDATPAVGSRLELARHYNSAADTTNYGFGAGWTHSYAWRLSTPDQTTARVVTGTGRTIVFTGGSPWAAPTGEHGTLIGKPGQGFTYTSVNGTAYRFDATGRLLSIQEATSPSPISIAYDKTGALASVTSGGSTLLFTSSDGYITSVSDPAGHVWRYERDGSNRLNLVTLPTGGQTSYTMTNVNVNGVSFRSGTGQITRVRALQAPDVWIDLGLFSYEGDPGQVTHAATGAIAGALQHEVSLSYALCTDAPSTTIATLEGGAKTILSAPIGGRQRLTAITATAGVGVNGEPTSQAFTWNPDLTLASVTAGAITNRYADYDSAGNARTVIEGAGSSVERTTRLTFHPVLQTVLSESRQSVDGTSTHVTINDYDADYDSAYNAAPTNFLHQVVETGKTDAALTGTASTPVTYTTTTMFDGNSRPARVTYPNGIAETFTYFGATADPTAQLRLASRTVGTLTDQITRYDANGRILETQDPNGVVTSTDYDELGNVTRTAVSSGAQLATDHYAYNLAGQLVSHTSPGSNAVVHEYDAASRAWRTHAQTASGTTPWSETRAFDAQDRVLAVRRFTGLGSSIAPTCAAGDEAAFCQSMTYDAFRRRASLTLLSSADQVCAGNDCRMTYSYDANGNVACSTEAGLQTTCFSRDGRGRLGSVVLPNRTATTFGYDINDRLIAKRDPRNRTSTFVWDDFGREISRTTLDSGRVVANFDGTGLRTSTLDARGMRLDTGFDLAGRQISVTVPADRSGNQDVYYGYDETGSAPGGTDVSYAFTRGRLTTISARGSDGSRIVSHRSYDYLGRVVDEVEERGGTAIKQHYALGAEGELVAQTLPSGKIINYQFAATDGSAPRPQPAGATAPFNGATQSLFSNASYAFDGALRSLTYANGEIRSTTRNKRGDVTRILSGPALDPWVDQRFDYDANGLGRVTAVHNFAGMYNAYDWTYGADELGRKTSSTDSVSGAIDTTSWTYDAVGNRTSETRNGTTTTYSYANPSNNRLTSLGGGASDAFGYDANGFLTSHTSPGASVSYVYDAQSRLSMLRDETSVASSLALPTSITFTYLATSCGGANIAFSINGTLAATAPANAGCTCSPGISTIVVTDPAIVGLLGSGKNTFTVAFPQYLAWAIATVNGNDFVLYDAGTPGDAKARNPDLCGGGYGYAAGPQALVQPSLGSVTFSWLATSCGGAQPITFSINGATAYATSANAGCTCAPGVATYKTSDASVLDLLHAGVNAFSAGFPQYLDWAVVSVEGQADVIVYDPSGHAAARDPNLCSPGMGSNVNVSASSASYAPRSTATYTYDGNGRIWERRLSNGRFTQTYYDASGRISEEKEFRGELAFGDPQYVVTDHVHVSGLLVAELTRVCKRTSPGSAYTCTDDDVRVVSEDMRAPAAISSMYAHPGLTWGTNTNPFGNWSNLGSLRGTDGKAPTSDDLAMTMSNLVGHDITHADPFDGLITGLDHGDRFKLSAFDRLGGPHFDNGWDGSAYSSNSITSALGQLGSFHAPSKGPGPEFNSKHDPWKLVGMHDGKLDEDDDPPEAAATTTTTTGSEPDRTTPSAPPATTPTSTPTTAAANTTPPPVVQAVTPVINLVMPFVHAWQSSPVQVGPGVSTDVKLPPLPKDTVGWTFTFNLPGMMCSPDADSDSCGGDVGGVTTGEPHLTASWISHPMNPADGSTHGTLTRDKPKPSAVDPIEPKELDYGFSPTPNLGDQMCADASRPCGTM